MMEIGMYIGGISPEKRVECYKKLGIKHTFIGSNSPDFDDTVNLFLKNGIICDFLHAPFNQINNMWSDNEEDAAVMYNLLKDSIDKCSKYKIPATIVHVSSGRPMPPITQNGVDRYEKLFEYAKQKGVMVALENLRYSENLEYFLNRNSEIGFCWDCGHEYCFTPGESVMRRFGNRTAALHIHDNRCLLDADDHLIPFDGAINFETVAKDIADSGYRDTLMLELERNSAPGGIKYYENLSDEEYIQRAYEAALKLADMVEKCRKQR